MIWKPQALPEEKSRTAPWVLSQNDLVLFLLLEEV